MKKRSLTVRLVLTVVLAELACALVLGAITLLHQRHESYKAFDVMLQGHADTVIGALQDAEDPGDNLMLTPSELSLPREDAFLVVTPEGRQVGARNWQAGFPMPATPGWSNFKWNHHRYRELRIDSVKLIDAGVAGKGGGISRPVEVLYVAATGHVWHEVLEGVRYFLLASLVVLTLTALALAWFVRRSLEPLRGLAEEASRVTADRWEFTPAAEVMQTSELAPLASSIATLLGDLEAEFAARRRFVSDAAHELKTAVAVTKSSLQLLTLRPRTAEELTSAIARPLSDNDRMEALVMRMLTLGRVDEQAPGAMEVCDLCGIAKSSIEALLPLAELHGVRVEARCGGDADAIGARVAEDDAVILCTNLLSNAIEHSARDGQIVVEAVREQGMPVLRVIDHGEGIPAEALPHLFERFYRTDKSRSRRTGGSGLGLAICKGIVTQAGGTIEIASEAGRGTTVTVRLRA
ncbi:sensor histidine kinase [Bryocella elongata]|nr:ATP-binding protein [Bryocella elongata]